MSERVREDINSKIRRVVVDHLGLEAEFRFRSDLGGRMMWTIDGQDMTTGDAADKYLPGGFSANFGLRS